VFSATLLSFGRGSGWNQLLYVITELPANFLRPVPRFEPLCMGACNVRPPLGTNHGLLKARPSSHHVHSTLPVTPPTLSADAECRTSAQVRRDYLFCTVRSVM